MSRRISRIAVAVAGAAALAATAALPAAAAGHGHHAPAPQHSRSAVVLGAIQYDSPGRDDRSNRSLNAEWVTVKNTGRLPVNIKGWTLSDKSGHSYRFGNLHLNGHSQIRVHTGTGQDNRRDRAQGGVNEHPAALIRGESCRAGQLRRTEPGGPHNGVSGERRSIAGVQAVLPHRGDYGVRMH